MQYPWSGAPGLGPCRYRCRHRPAHFRDLPRDQGLRHHNKHRKLCPQLDHLRRPRPPSACSDVEQFRPRAKTKTAGTTPPKRRPSGFGAVSVAPPPGVPQASASICAISGPRPAPTSPDWRGAPTNTGARYGARGSVEILGLAGGYFQDLFSRRLLASMGPRRLWRHEGS